MFTKERMLEKVISQGYTKLSDGSYSKDIGNYTISLQFWGKKQKPNVIAFSKTPINYLGAIKDVSFRNRYISCIEGSSFSKVYIPMALEILEYRLKSLPNNLPILFKNNLEVSK